MEVIASSDRPKVGPILIDLDGTLVSLNPPRDELENLRKDVTSISRTFGVSLDTTSIFPMYRSVLALLGFDSAPAVSIRERLDQSEVLWSRTTAQTLVARSVLEHAAEVRPLVLVTSNGTACVHALFGGDLLPNVFTALVTRDDVADLKPAAYPIAEALRRAPTGCALADFVGDSAADRDSALAYEKGRGRSIPARTRTEWSAAKFPRT